MIEVGTDVGDAAVVGESTTIAGEVSVIPIMFNVYFYPLALYPVREVPEQYSLLYVGIGVGVGLYSIDATPRVDDGFTEALIGNASIGYDYYVMPNIVVGAQYQFSFGYDITPEMAGAADRLSPFPEVSFHQNSHNVHLTARYEF